MRKCDTYEEVAAHLARNRLRRRVWACPRGGKTAAAGTGVRQRLDR